VHEHRGPSRDRRSSQHFRAGACSFCAALDTSSAGTALEPDLKGPIEKVLSALSAEKMVPGANLAELKPMLAEIRITMLQGTKLLFPQTRIGMVPHGC
jgi:hypothetical protein